MPKSTLNYHDSIKTIIQYLIQDSQYQAMSLTETLPKPVGRLARPNVTLYVNTGGIPGSRYWRGSIPKYRY
jgi:hypothetical protein